MKRVSIFLLCSVFCVAVFVSGSIGQGGAETVSLFSGNDLSGWNAMWDSNAWMTAANVQVGTVNKTRFAIEAGEGILVNGPTGNTTNIYTEYKHDDCRLQIEFMVPHNSNSGVYFQGLYEIQVLDSYGKTELGFHDCGGIYARFKDGQTYEGHPPRVNASNPPGVWQSYDVIFRAPRFDAQGNKSENARFVRVVHNGVVVHENVDLTGNTRASMDLEEAPLGPLMLQGDHGPVAYRNIRLTPLSLD